VIAPVIVAALVIGNESGKLEALDAHLRLDPPQPLDYGRSLIRVPSPSW
jgi:hypothetical protein